MLNQGLEGFVQLARDFCRLCETRLPAYCPECGNTVTGSRLCRTMPRHRRVTALPVLGGLCPDCRAEPSKLTRDEHLHQLWMVLGLGD